MSKRCIKCGKTFDDRFCPECAQYRYSEISELLLHRYHDSNGNLLKEVFIGVPKKLAKLFALRRLASKQLREVHQRIWKARSTAVLKGIDKARPILWECHKHISYQLGRKMIPKDFEVFMKHHLNLAEKSDKMLEGFYQHIDAVVCYFKER